MKKVILLLMFCIVVLALCTWGNRLSKAPAADKVELRPELVPFYLVTRIPEFFIPPKQHNDACADACRKI